MSLGPTTRTLLRGRSLFIARPGPLPFLRTAIVVPTLPRLPPPRRWNSSSFSSAVPPAPPAPPTPPTPPTLPNSETPSLPPKEQQPSYQLTFTCRPCQTRSTHTISKQAYHGGSVLVQCPGCKSRHVIADHLKIFGDTYRSMEDILAESGEVLKKARLLENGVVEFYEEEVGDLLPPMEERL